MICRKAIVISLDANFPSSWCQTQSPRAQNRGFCAHLAFGTPVFGHFEHKIGVFVRFWGLKPSFSGISSTKSGFLCAFGLRDRHFLAFRSQKRGFCALLPAGRAERAGRTELEGRAGRTELEGRAGRAERAERTRRAERAGELSLQKKEGGQCGHPLEFCISAVGLLTLCLQVSCKMQGGVLQTPL